MDLILWRHAEAEYTYPDGTRALTGSGRHQADIVARWLKHHLPRDFRTLVSPTLRTRETAQALTANYSVSEAVGLGARPSELLVLAGWPDEQGAVLIVGHQPTLGQTAALALTGKEFAWSVRKAGVWWLSRQGRGLDAETVVRAVISPEILMIR